MENKETILCAAIRRLEPRKTKSLPYNKGTNDILNIELGYRHHDIYSRFNGEVGTSPDDQGFYTSKGRFVGRKEAMKIAFEAGQVDAEHAFMSYLKGIKLNTLDNYEAETNWNDFRPLCSEDLY